MVCFVVYISLLSPHFPFYSYSCHYSRVLIRIFAHILTLILILILAGSMNNICSNSSSLYNQSRKQCETFRMLNIQYEINKLFPNQKSFRLSVISLFETNYSPILLNCVY